MNVTSTRRARRVAVSVAALALGLGLTACGAANEQPSGGTSNAASGTKLSGTLNGAGSSAQEAAQGAWQAGFQTANPDVTVNYDPVGSGGGREQFIAGGVDFAGSDAYMTSDELTGATKRCNNQAPIEIPDYVSPIAIIFNIDGVDKLQLSPATLAQIFSGKITKWNDPAIAAENQGVKLPSASITAVHRADDSGTTENFTDYLNKTAPSDWTNAADGVWPLKGGEAATGTSGVVAAVKNGANSIGYADASQAGDLGKAAVKVGNEYVEPSAEAAAKILEISPKVKGSDANAMVYNLDRTTTESGVYPIVLTSYIIACPTYSDQAKADLVKGYLTYVLGSDGQQAAAKTAGSAPLPSSIEQQALQIADSIKAAG